MLEILLPYSPCQEFPTHSNYSTPGHSIHSAISYPSKCKERPNLKQNLQ
uniref:Uncharacterized protein n=1 Tax=Arundo donax TaxID=35708 RepID=A0A0A9C8F4_ARUDO